MPRAVPDTKLIKRRQGLVCGVFRGCDLTLGFCLRWVVIDWLVVGSGDESLMLQKSFFSMGWCLCFQREGLCNRATGKNYWFFIYCLKQARMHLVTWGSVPFLSGDMKWWEGRRWKSQAYLLPQGGRDAWRTDEIKSLGDALLGIMLHKPICYQTKAIGSSLYPGTFGGATWRGMNDAVCPVLTLRSSKSLLTPLIYIRLGARETLEDFHSFNKCFLST